MNLIIIIVLLFVADTNSTSALPRSAKIMQHIIASYNIPLIADSVNAKVQALLARAETSILNIFYGIEMELGQMIVGIPTCDRNVEKLNGQADHIVCQGYLGVLAIITEAGSNVQNVCNQVIDSVLNEHSNGDSGQSSNGVHMFALAAATKDRIDGILQQVAHVAMDTFQSALAHAKEMIDFPHPNVWE